MSAILFITVLLQVAVPLGLITWQTAGRDASFVSWVLKQTAVWTYIYATSVAGLWLFAPWYVPHALLVISIAVGVRSLPDPFRLWQSPATVGQWIGLGTRATAVVLSTSVLYLALQGGTPPGDAGVDLSFPLKAGRYYVVNGGSSELVNAHLKVRAGERFWHYRGSSYGVDIVALNAAGARADGPSPRDPTKYAIFGDAIYAPCEGVVVRVEDWLPDLMPPDVDRVHLPGNFVMLECGDAGEFHVLLAHMRAQSVRVHPGDYVTSNTMLGEVGNSGNSNEPHLHVHAQRPGRIWDPFIGDPLPIRFDGRYLIRNDRITPAALPNDDVIDD
jgi:hypothetical protein